MLRQLLDFVTGGTSSQPAAAAAAVSSSSSARSSQPHPTRQSNVDRLQAIGYQNDIPKQFEDCTTLDTMDDPVIVNGCAAQILDKRTFEQRSKEKDKCTGFLNPLTGTFYPKGIVAVETDADLAAYKQNYPVAPGMEQEAAYYTSHLELKRTIDRFVSTLEGLHLQLKHLNNLLCPIDDDLVSLFENVSHTMVTQYIEQQKCERVDTIQQTKQMIIDILINFIRETDAVINRQELTKDEIARSSRQILTGPQLLQNLLIAELEHLASLPASKRYDTAIQPGEYYTTLAFKPVNLEVQERINQRITSLADASIAIKLQTENETPQAPSAPARVQLTLFYPLMTTAIRLRQMDVQYYHGLLTTIPKSIQSREQIEQSRAASQAATSNSSTTTITAASASASAAAAAAAASMIETTVDRTDTTSEQIRPAAPRSPSLRRSYDNDVD